MSCFVGTSSDEDGTPPDDEKSQPSEVGNEFSARVYLPGGEPAQGAAIQFLPYDTLRQRSQIFKATTDTSGKYQFNKVPNGQYSLWMRLAEKNGQDTLVAFQDQVEIFNSNHTIISDTLELPRVIEGVVKLQPQDSSRLERVIVQILGTPLYTLPNKSGKFSFPSVPSGRYVIRFELSDYGPSPKSANLTKEGNLNLGTIELDYKGIPYIQNIKASYDTTAGVSTITWNKPDTKAEYFIIYRSGRPGREINTPIGYVDGSVYHFTDSLFSSSPDENQLLSFSYTPYTITYRVAIVNQNIDTGKVLEKATIQALSPAALGSDIQFSLFSPDSNAIPSSKVTGNLFSPSIIGHDSNTNILRENTSLEDIVDALLNIRQDEPDFIEHPITSGHHVQIQTSIKNTRAKVCQLIYTTSNGEGLKTKTLSKCKNSIVDTVPLPTSKTGKQRITLTLMGASGKPVPFSTGILNYRVRVGLEARVLTQSGIVSLTWSDKDAILSRKAGDEERFEKMSIPKGVQWSDTLFSSNPKFQQKPMNDLNVYTYTYRAVRDNDTSETSISIHSPVIQGDGIFVLVSDKAGHPIQGAHATLYLDTLTSSPITSRTSNIGVAAFHNVPSGIYNLFIQSENPTLSSTINTIHFQNGDTTILETILGPPIRLSGEVILKPWHNDILPRVQVKIKNTDIIRPLDVRGRFEFLNLAPGEYSLVFFTSHPDYSDTEIDVNLQNETLIPPVKMDFIGIPKMAAPSTSLPIKDSVIHIKWFPPILTFHPLFFIQRDTGDGHFQFLDSTSDLSYQDTVFSQTSERKTTYFSYRVAIHNREDKIGPYSEPQQITAHSPKTYQSIFDLGFMNSRTNEIKPVGIAGDHFRAYGIVKNHFHKLDSVHCYIKNGGLPPRTVVSVPDTLRTHFMVGFQETWTYPCTPSVICEAYQNTTGITLGREEFVFDIQ